MKHTLKLFLGVSLILSLTAFAAPSTSFKSTGDNCRPDDFCINLNLNNIPADKVSLDSSITVVYKSGTYHDDVPFVNLAGNKTHMILGFPTKDDGPISSIDIKFSNIQGRNSPESCRIYVTGNPVVMPGNATLTVTKTQVGGYTCTELKN